MTLAEDVQARLREAEANALAMHEVRPGVRQSLFDLRRGVIELELTDAEIAAYAAEFMPGVDPKHVRQAGLVRILHKDKGERPTDVAPLTAKPVNRKNDLARFRVNEQLAKRDGLPPPVPNAYERRLIREELAEHGGGEDPTQPGFEPDDAPDPVPQYPLPPGHDFMAAAIAAARAAVREELRAAGFKPRGVKRAKPKRNPAGNTRKKAARAARGNARARVRPARH